MSRKKTKRSVGVCATEREITYGKQGHAKRMREKEKVREGEKLLYNLVTSYR